jgi:hypothetical protein
MFCFVATAANLRGFGEVPKIQTEQPDNHHEVKAARRLVIAEMNRIAAAIRDGMNLEQLSTYRVVVAPRRRRSLAERERSGRRCESRTVL